MRNLLILFFGLLTFNCYAQKGNTCPVTGDTKGTTPAAQHHRNVDSYKNRGNTPNHYTFIKFSDMENLTLTNNMTWDTAVYIDAYILAVEDGGTESCNCHSTKYKDTHIYIVENSIGDVSGMTKKDLTILKKKLQSQAIIVEATPRFREKLGETTELQNYIGKRVRIYGYLFRDDEHKMNSTVDNGSGLHWRHTVWEIHPITDMMWWDGTKWNDI